MSYRNYSRLAALFIASLPLGACARTAVSEEAVSKAFKVESIEGTDLKRVILSDAAAQRLDIQTTAVRSVAVRGTQRKVVPYSAILYDAEGHTWAYTSPAPLTFVRVPVTVDYVEGDVAVLSDGPAAAVRVVTVGAAELYGCEEEFEEE